MRRSSIFTALAVFLAPCGAACAASGETVERDVRRDKSAQGLYIVFCSRTSLKTRLPGHAFVVWGRDDAQRQMCVNESFGFYPKEGKGILGPVPGEITSEIVKDGGERTCRLILKVDRDQYRQAEAIRSHWAGRMPYRLVERDCVTFADEVAGALKLSRPDRKSGGFLPQTYIRDLAEKNR